MFWTRLLGADQSSSQVSASSASGMARSWAVVTYAMLAEIINCHSWQQKSTSLFFTGKERKPHELTVVTLVRPVPEAGSVDIHPMQDSTVLALCHQRRSSIIVQSRAVLGQQFSRDTCVFFSLLIFYRKPAEPCKIQVWDLVLIAIHRIRALS
jgi:hypothetical protein